MNLATMTREELKALSKAELMWLAHKNALRMDCATDGGAGCYSCTFERLNTLRLELQQAAEARQDSQQNR